MAGGSGWLRGRGRDVVCIRAMGIPRWVAEDAAPAAGPGKGEG